jgi:hypothetical protein
MTNHAPRYESARSSRKHLGQHAYETVRQHFLFPVMILDYLKALARVQTEAYTFAEPKIIPINMPAIVNERVA